MKLPSHLSYSQVGSMLHCGDAAERLVMRLAPRLGGCLEWIGPVNPGGYGRISVNGRNVLVHRFAWELANNQPVPDGKMILHSCDNPPCCLPSHLRPGTSKDNNAEREAKGRGHQSSLTHCPQNHPYDEVNTLVRPNGQRMCRTCNRAYCARYTLAHSRKKVC